MLDRLASVESELLNPALEQARTRPIRRRRQNSARSMSWNRLGVAFERVAVLTTRKLKGGMAARNTVSGVLPVRIPEPSLKPGPYSHHHALLAVHETRLFRVSSLSSLRLASAPKSSPTMSRAIAVDAALPRKHRRPRAGQRPV